MELITSRSNPLITETAKLKDKKYRNLYRSFLFEGIKLMREAVASKVDIEYVFLTERAAERYTDAAMHEKAVLISESVCEKLSENKAPEGIICRAKYIDRLHKDGLSSEPDSNHPCLILSGLQDPGNLGTIIRTSASLGKKSIIISDDCADIYNPKTLRASMGAIFRSAVYRTDNIVSAIQTVKKQGFDVYATALTEKAMPIQEIKNAKNACFVLGNEGHGLSDSVINACSGTVIIPMEEDAESLNVSSAAAIVLWEAYR